MFESDDDARLRSSKRGRLNRLQVISSFFSSQLGRDIVLRLQAARGTPNRAISPTAKDDPLTHNDEKPLAKSGPVRITVRTEDVIEKLLSGNLSVQEASNLVGTTAANFQFKYVPSLDEIYDAFVLRINAIDCLDYFIGTEIMEDLDAIFMFFDCTMPSFYASQLLVSFGEVMAGTKVVQQPDNREPDQPWVFVATPEEVDLNPPPVRVQVKPPTNQGLSWQS